MLFETPLKTHIFPLAFGRPFVVSYCRKVIIDYCLWGVSMFTHDPAVAEFKALANKVAAACSVQRARG